MVVDFHTKCIFQHIFKTGGTSITNALQSYRQVDATILTEWCKDRNYTSKNNTLFNEFGNHHIIYDQFHAIWPKINFKEFYNFCFVRNTYDWIVSGYKYCSGENYFGNYPPDMKIEKANEFTFKYYVENWVLPDCTQWDFMTFKGEMIMNFVGRFEHLQEDYNKLTDILELPRRQLLNLNPGNKIKYVSPEVTEKANQHYSLWYTDELLEKVTKYAKKEIDYFNFKFDDKR